MKTQRTGALVLAVLFGVMPGLAQNHRGGSGTPTHPTTQAPAASQTSGRVGVGVTPGWGLAPDPGYGNVNHPGGSVTGTFPLFIQPLPTVVQPLVNLDPNRTPVQSDRFQRRGFRHTNTVIVPYFVPQQTVVYMIPPQSEPPQDQMIYNEPPPVGPSVWGGSQPPLTIINNIHVPAPAPGPTPTVELQTPEPAPRQLTLLVFKDHSIYAATDYWVENGSLTYVTNYGSTNTIDVNKLDLDFTKKLNDERNVKFELKEH